MGAMEDVLGISELLKEIFSHCNQRDNYSNAVVAKSWSNEALNLLWEDLSTLKPLLTLLAPLIRSEGHVVRRLDAISSMGFLQQQYQKHLYFERPLRSSGWAVFDKYAWRVRHLSMSSRQDSKYSPSVFLHIASSRPPVDLFPNLRSLLVISSLLHVMPLFVHTNLATLGLAVSSSRAGLNAAKAALTYAPYWCPNLKLLSLRNDEKQGTPINIGGFRSALTSLPHLTSVDISPHLLTSQVVHTLARLPQLELLCSVSELPNDSLALPSPPRGGFPSITVLLLSYPLEHVASLLESCKPTNLRYLMVLTHDFPREYIRVYKVAMSRCPKLQTLRLVSHTRRWTFHLEGSTLSLLGIPVQQMCILDIMKSLRAVRHISMLYWRETLRLDAFPINVLVELARLCPELITLTIDVDTSSCTHTTAIALDAPPPRFRHLQDLNVAHSYLDSPAFQVTAFLSCVLSEGCRLSRLRAPMYDDDRYESWQPVIDALPAFIRVRNADRAAAAAAAKAAAVAAEAAEAAAEAA